MPEAHCKLIATELGITEQQVRAVEELLKDGATVPFIARYRKEKTGSLDEVAITIARDRLVQLEELDKRREAILKSLDERDLLTEELKGAIENVDNMATLEDIYLPYRPKRRTRATMAREKGLEPLAENLFSQEGDTNPLEEAIHFINKELGVESAEDALAGARDIIAEWVNEDAETRQVIRNQFVVAGNLTSKVIEGNEQAGTKYRDYFDWQEPVSRVPSHRLLAIFRGEKEGYLRISIRPLEDETIEYLLERYIKGKTLYTGQVAQAVEDSYKRLLAPSMETEIRHEAKERAEDEAIHVFASNLRQILMAAPLGQKTVLAIDPGYRTGCKVACLDKQGKLLHTTTFYLNQSEGRTVEATDIIQDLVKRFNIETIDIGNGTASRETESFMRGLDLPKSIPIIVVNESGASIYSASKIAREEFPDQDVTVRGAVSIGRRLMDPLAELVKIDPKSIGVGQYQHDVDQSRLKDSLVDVVMSCVNNVGVDVNTASKELLSYVSGLGPAMAKNIVEYRNENGPFRSREELKQVRRLGPKAFEQAAGFLRIRDAAHPLDASAVHPESYTIVDRMAQDLGCTVRALMEREDLRRGIDINQYIANTVGLPTLTDIMEELAKPGRDPRHEFETFSFPDEITTMEDLKEGMKLPGVVTNVTNFGAFVDIGVHQDGLVHISELADRFVRNPINVVKVNQRVSVIVLAVDKDRRRISLSMRKDPKIPKDRMAS